MNFNKGVSIDPSPRGRLAETKVVCVVFFCERVDVYTYFPTIFRGDIHCGGIKGALFHIGIVFEGLQFITPKPQQNIILSVNWDGREWRESVFGSITSR
jgi:hypothetical protein